jgi:Holliday junction resolvase-like predicted endonuclease
LDAIALSGDRATLAFVEVKTRSPGNWDAGGRGAISARKQAALVRSALQFLGDTPLWEGLDLGNVASRFDVAIVEYRGDVATGALANTAPPMNPDLEAAIAHQSIQIGEPVTLDLDAAGTMTVTLQDYLVHAFTAESAFA